MVTRVTDHLRLDKRYFKELSFIQVALQDCVRIMAKVNFNRLTVERKVVVTSQIVVTRFNKVCTLDCPLLYIKISCLELLEGRK